MSAPVLFDIPGPKARARIRIGTAIGYCGTVFVGLLTGLALACGSSSIDEPLADASTDTDESGTADETSDACAQPIELPESPAPPLAWAAVGELDIDDQGLSSVIELPLAAPPPDISADESAPAERALQEAV